MQLSQTDIQEFKDLYEEEFKEELSWSEAAQIARDLINLFEFLYDSCPNGPTVNHPLEGDQVRKAPPAV